MARSCKEQAQGNQTYLKVMEVIHSAAIDGILQQAPQLLPVGLPALAVSYHHICTASQVAEVEVIEAGPSLHSEYVSA